MRGLVFVVSTPFLWWLISSAADPWWEMKSLTLSPERLTAVKSTSKYKDLRIGLALSGGGYRAALMHAGVLDAAERHRLHFTHLSSVSGGSIIAGFYSAGGAPRDFVDAVKDGKFALLRAATRVQNLFRLKHRSDVQASLLEKLIFGNKTLSQLAAGGPQLLMCTTNLYDGASVGWGPSFVLLKEPLGLYEKHRFMNAASRHSSFATTMLPYAPEFAGSQSASKFVVASGAFPLAFNPISIELSYMSFDQRRDRRFLLTDGGVSDNSGLDLLLDAHRESGGTVLGFPQFSKFPEFSGKTWPRLSGWEMDLVLSSDATATFSRVEKLGPVSELSRATDIIYRNTRSRDLFPYALQPVTIILNPEHLGISLRPQEGENSRDHFLKWLLMGSHWRTAGFDSIKVLVESFPDSVSIGPARVDELRKMDFIANGSISKNDLLQLFNMAKSNTKDANLVLENVLTDDLDNCLRRFSDTPTLQDRFAPTEAEELYRLGVYVFCLNWLFSEPQLNSLDWHRQEADQIWKILLRSCNERFISGHVPLFSPESELQQMFFPTKSPGNELWPRVGELLERSARSWPKAVKDKRAALSAVLAHRLAHGIYHQDHPDWHYSENRSLLEEIRGGVLIWEDHEQEVDYLTIRLLLKAKLPSNGLSLIFAKCIEKYGLDGVHPSIPRRLRRVAFQEIKASLTAGSHWPVLGW